MSQRAFVTTLLLACLPSAASLYLMAPQAPGSPDPRAPQASGSPHPRGPVASSSPHHWPLALGPDQHSASGAVLPFPLERALNWSWHHPQGRYANTIAGGPIIDAEKNLYVASNDGYRKLSPDGKTLWWFFPPGSTNNEPALYGDSVIGNTFNAHAFAIDRHTGKALWVKRMAKTAGGDVGNPAAHDGIYVMGVDVPKWYQAGDAGNERTIGINATTGEQVWEYRTEWPTWNFMPLFAGDDTFVFSDITGGIYRLGLHNGSQVWHTPAPDTDRSKPSYTDGGAVMGTNGLVYTCSQPGKNMGDEGTTGVLRAYKFSSGELAWTRLLPQPCASFPAVGRLGEGPELSVVVAPGSFPGTGLTLHGGLMAFDAESGRLQWKWQAPPYKRFPSLAKGDLEGIAERRKYNPWHPMCGPAHWSAPHILGDGSVIAGRMDGVLYKVKGPTEGLPDEDTSKMSRLFATSPGVVVQDKFDAHGAALHGAMAVAPGMFAFATCTENMFVFKY